MLRFDRGDTIIEVMVAFAVFSLISVGAMTIMGQGTNASQRALEITLVRQQIDAQAEALRAAQQASKTGGSSSWDTIALPASENSLRWPNEDSCPTKQNDVSKSFIMDARTATPITTGEWLKDISNQTAVPYAQVQYTGVAVTSYGIWIERDLEDSGTSLPNLYGFTVRACWYGAGLSTPLQIETLVRLYEPGA